MAFSDFKNIEQVIQHYPLQLQQVRFLPETERTPPESFLENINFLLDKKAIDESEAFLSEGFIFPFLQQAWKLHEKLKLWSHRPLVFDDQLFGEPDYFVSAWPRDVIEKLVNTPVLAIVEAKKQDFAWGWGQCLAEMIACQKINRNENITVYGIVTTGIIWEFAKLSSHIFTKHPLAYSISDSRKIYGILDFIFGECERQLN